MKNALILHGTNANPEQNWFRWLERELIVKGYKVWVPQLPNSVFPNVKRYNKFIFDSGWEFNNESVLIGHSAGSVEILGLLQKLPEGTVIDHAILVGAFTEDLKWPNLQGLFEEPFDLEKIKSRARKFTFLHSDDDPFCPLKGAQYLSEKLGGELHIVKGAKHFSIGTGGERFKELPVLLEFLQKNGNFS